MVGNDKSYKISQLNGYDFHAVDFPASILDHDTGCPDRGFSSFPSVASGKCWKSNSK
jgi:hypothetical protein